jgi:glycerol-3-phosphate dehydrogenase (NAD(P)+)
MKRVAIIGGGGWGTALSIALSGMGHPIRLWVYEPELVPAINEERCNPLYLSGFSVPEPVVATGSLGFGLEGAEIVVTALPANCCRRIYQEMLPYLCPEAILVSATKGLESASLQRMSEVMEAVIAPCFRPRMAAISGPTFAREVARGDPTALVVAGPDPTVNRVVQTEFSSPLLRFYTNTDIIGVELGGAVKNVIAIAAGVCAGMGLGCNSVAAVVTRGLVEMTRLVVACGGRSETMAGLAGMGDLVLTCHGELSRNRRVGFQLGKGHGLDAITAGMRTVAEGIPATGATLKLAARHRLEMPITEQVNLLLHHQKNPRDAVRDLMERRLREE